MQDPTDQDSVLVTRKSHSRGLAGYAEMKRKLEKSWLLEKYA
jgi:hypothetical protein